MSRFPSPSKSATAIPVTPRSPDHRTIGVRFGCPSVKLMRSKPTMLLTGGSGIRSAGKSCGHRRTYETIASATFLELNFPAAFAVYDDRYGTTRGSVNGFHFFG